MNNRKEESLENFTYNDELIRDSIYFRYYGLPNDSTSAPEEPKNPLDRHFELQRSLLLPNNRPCLPIFKNIEKRGIMEEVEKVSQALRSGPPKVVESPPWSKGMKNICNVPNADIKENNPKNNKSINSYRNRVTEGRICLNTNLFDSSVDSNSGEDFSPIMYEEAASTIEVASNDTDNSIDLISEESLPGSSTSE